MCAALSATLDRGKRILCKRRCYRVCALYEIALLQVTNLTTLATTYTRSPAGSPTMLRSIISIAIVCVQAPRIAK